MSQELKILKQQLNKKIILQHQIAKESKGFGALIETAVLSSLIQIEMAVVGTIEKLDGPRKD